MATLDGRPLPGMPRSRAEAWAAHERWVREQARLSGENFFLLMMLERQRLDFEAGRFPLAWEEDDATPAASVAAVKAAIGECLSAGGGRHIGEAALWPLVQEKLAPRVVPRRMVRDNMPKMKSGRPKEIRHKM
jgi:hypothetical protein